MSIIYISNKLYEKPVIYYGLSPKNFYNKTIPTNYTYSIGHFPFKGVIYHGIMTELMPDTTYYYKVGDDKTNKFSTTRQFTSLPKDFTKPTRKITFGTFGDMGTIMPMGFRVSERIKQDNWKTPFDLVLLVGDISYAAVSGEDPGEFAPVWDMFGR